jgi:hypothetical protein
MKVTIQIKTAGKYWEDTPANVVETEVPEKVAQNIAEATGREVRITINGSINGKYFHPTK